MAAPTPYTSSSTNVYSIDPYQSGNINALLSGVKWGTGGIGTGASLYYSFPTSNNPALWDQGSDAYLYAPNYETYAGFRGLTITQQSIATTILESWASVANISLNRVNTESSSEVGDIRIAFTADGYMGKDDYAYAYYPGDSYGGDIWLNARQPVASGNNFNPGGNGYQTILHEVGHALGLTHSFGGFYSVTNTNYDSFKYTVMSYSDAPLHQDRGNSSFYPTTPMLLDIQAMQYLYGANMNYHTGDDVYVFNSASSYYQTIWDAGGTDTIQYLSATGGIINLEAGSFSILGKAIKLDKGVMQSDNVAIAYNVTIENAIGGDGHDVIYGNAAANILTGKNGNDSLYGKASNDRLRGGFGNDYLDGGADKDIMDGRAGNDIYIVDDIDDVVIEVLPLAKMGGVDTVKSSVNFTLGDNVENLTLTDGSFNGGLTNLNGTGNAINNVIIGNAGNNILSGNAGNDTLIGGAGNDTLYGGSGNDLLTGGIGADTFIWTLADKSTNASPAVDKITDFNLAQGDQLNLADLLTGEHDTADSLLNYLDITTSSIAGITNTEIRISNQGLFNNGQYALAAENQHITLAGVNLFAATNTHSEADLIQNLISNNKLIVDA